VRRSGAASKPWACPRRGCGDTPPFILGSPVAGIAETRSSTAHPPSMRSTAGSSATRTSRTCPASSRPRSPARPSRRGARDQRVAFVGVNHPSTAPASTSGSAAPLQPTRRSASAWRLGPAGRGPGRPRGHPLDLPRLRLRRLRPRAPPEVPGRGLGCGEVPPDLGGRLPPAELVDGPAPDQRSPGGATTSVCTARTTAASTSVSHARRPRGRYGRSRRSPMAAAHGSGPSVTTVEQKMNRSTWRKARSSRWWRVSKPSDLTCQAVHLPAAARWPAPASSTASSRSSRPRRAVLP